MASPIAALDGSYICLECLPVGYTGTSAMHTVRMSQFLAGCQLDKATQVCSAVQRHRVILCLTLA